MKQISKSICLNTHSICQIVLNICKEQGRDLCKFLYDLTTEQWVMDKWVFARFQLKYAFRVDTLYYNSPVEFQSPAPVPLVNSACCFTCLAWSHAPDLVCLTAKYKTLSVMHFIVPRTQIILNSV